ncbi:MAG: nucleotidyltransferase domain-containing protein [Candidatus Thermoplasmatota archaeon]
MDRTADIVRELSNFKRHISNSMKIQAMIFFGSHATGKAGPWSDIDLIIVSPMFRGIRFRRRALGLHKHWAIDLPVDFLCYTPEEFERKKKEIGVVNEAVKEGIVI